MSNFIEKSVQEIFDESMANAFIRDRVEPVEEVEETFRSTLASRIETDRKEKYEEEQRLIEIEEKKMYKSEKATTSDEKNKEIIEKSVKNTIILIVMYVKSVAHSMQEILKTMVCLAL